MVTPSVLEIWRITRDSGGFKPRSYSKSEIEVKEGKVNNNFPATSPRENL